MGTSLPHYGKSMGSAWRPFIQQYCCYKHAACRFAKGRRRITDRPDYVKLMKEHPVIIVGTLAVMSVGAILGAVAFYQGWLG